MQKAYFHKQETMKKLLLVLMINKYIKKIDNQMVF